jgi:hypothetical protein
MVPGAGLWTVLQARAELLRLKIGPTLLLLPPYAMRLGAGFSLVSMLTSQPG